MENHHGAAITAGATEMDFTGRPMRGMVIVPAERVRDDHELRPWITQAVDFAKTPKAQRR